VHGGQPINGEGGREVGRYRVLGRLGEGGMAVVHLAHDPDLDRLVALKEVVADNAADPHWTARFLRESRVVGSLKHPNIVTVFEYLEQDGAPYIAMEYVERGSLRPYVGMLTLAQNAQVLESVLAGLTHAERRGIVHRDLKPENLLVTEEGGVKIADFGIAKLTGELAGPALLRTAEGSTVGTPLYMAPEQALGRSDEIGPWTDLYAVGCIAYELFTGAPPFASVTNPQSMMLCHVYEAVPPAHEANPNVDRVVSGWIDGLLVKDPALRVRSAQAAWESLEEIVLTRLSARWRRDAALLELGAVAAVSPPLSRSGIVHATPGGSAEFVSFNPRPVPGPPAVTPVGMLSALAPWHVDTPDPSANGRLAAREEEPRPSTLVLPSSPEADPAFAATRPPKPRNAPTAPQPTRPLRRPLFAVAGVVVVAVLAVVLVGRGGDDPPAPAATRAAHVAPTSSTLSAGPLSVRLPAGWGRRAADALGGLELDGAAVAGPPGDGGGTVVVGLAASTSPTLLPDALASSAPPPAPETLAGGLSAYRYDGLDLGGGSRAVVYAVPTEAGVATVACRQPAPADDAFAAACTGIARSLAVADTQVFTAGPSAQYADAVTDAVRDANHLLTSTALQRAKTPASQSRAVDGFPARLDRIAAHLRALALSPVDRAPNIALARAIAGLATGYGSLASAAHRSQPERYRQASAKLRAARSAAASSLADLRAAGYRDLPALASPALAGLKPKPRTQTKAPTTPTTHTVQATPVPTVTQPTYTAPQKQSSTPQNKYGPRKGSTPGDG
jgi:serine/threonine protein kinase